MDTQASDLPSPKPLSLLLVDDDEASRRLLAVALEARGFQVTQAATREEAIDLMLAGPFGFAIFDLNLPDGSGLDLMTTIQQTSQAARVMVLTGHGDIPTAIAAARLGVFDYMLKPADPDEIAALLRAAPGQAAKPPAAPKSSQRVRWEHIQSIHLACHGNVSLTARRLQMHRRTLQRIMAKRAPR